MNNDSIFDDLLEPNVNMTEPNPQKTLILKKKRKRKG